MRLLEAVRMAFQTIRAQKLKSFFSLIGVLIGVMFLIAVVSIVQGMNRYMVERFANTLVGANTFELRQRPSIMVGGVGVVAIMMISVTERTREIGVRKALGATRQEIMFQFLVEAATLTLVGCLAGMAMGALIAWAVRSFTPIPATVPLLSVVAAVVAAILTGVLFGIYPARKASRLDPVEALRYE